jgi:hypothetical protein
MNWPIFSTTSMSLDGFIAGPGDGKQFPPAPPQVPKGPSNLTFVTDGIESGMRLEKLSVNDGHLATHIHFGC